MNLEFYQYLETKTFPDGGKTDYTATTNSRTKAENLKRHTTTPADDSGLVQPVLPAIPRGQVKVDQISQSLSRARRRREEEQPIIVHPFR